jgi:hypothetical protein
MLNSLHPGKKKILGYKGKVHTCALFHPKIWFRIAINQITSYLLQLP